MTKVKKCSRPTVNCKCTYCASTMDSHNNKDQPSNQLTWDQMEAFNEIATQACSRHFQRSKT